MLFNLIFANNTIFPWFIFLIIDLYISFDAVIAHIFSPIAELVISIVIPTKEAKEEIETHPIIMEAKIRNFSI